MSVLGVKYPYDSIIFNKALSGLNIQETSYLAWGGGELGVGGRKSE